MPSLRRALIIGLTVTLAAMLAPAGAAAAEPPAWAPVEEATIHPGSQTVSPSGQCTSNFIFYDRLGGVYVGQAAHCTGTGGATDINGCNSGSLPLGTEVAVGGASQPGTLVYNSWLTMQAAGETDPLTCLFNDFALVQLHPDDVAKVNPSLPNWGGPVALGTTTTTLEQVYSYGNSGLRQGLTLLSPKTGVSLGQTDGGWTHPVYTVTPGIPGDSGSGFLNSRGEAVGVLSTVQLLPLVLSNGVSDLHLAMQYMQNNSGFDDVELAAGTEPFDGSPVNLLPSDLDDIAGPGDPSPAPPAEPVADDAGPDDPGAERAEDSGITVSVAGITVHIG